MTDWTKRVRRLGRTHTDNGLLWLGFSGSGIAFQVTGERCAVIMHGDSTAVNPGPDTHTARYALYVDGVQVLAEMMDVPDRILTVFEGTEQRTARVELIKLSESAMSTLAVAGIDTDGTVIPLPEREHLIEFVGDSITCGYGVDTSAPEQLFHTNNEDVTKGYAWQSAELLNADRTMVCLSGWGIISGWTPDPEKPSLEQLLPKYYECCGFSYAVSGSAHMQDWPWYFDGRQPDVVVVNLGTNDASYTVEDPEKQELYCREYQTFLKKIRSRNPDAQLLCILGVMGDVLYPMVEKAVREYTADTGDTRIQAMHLDAIVPETEGYVADYHPSVTTHARIARVIAERLRTML